MTQSRVDDVIDALTTAFDAASSLDGVTIVKGWQVLAIGDLEYVFVASDGTDTPDNEVASSTIEWAGLGAMARNEAGIVTCTAWTQTGDQSDMAGRISRAYELVGACEDIVKANITLSGAVTFQAGVASTGLHTVQSTEGCAAFVVFTVTFNTRI